MRVWVQAGSGRSAWVVRTRPRGSRLRAVPECAQRFAHQAPSTTTVTLANTVASTRAAIRWLSRFRGPARCRSMARSAAASGPMPELVPGSRAAHGRTRQACLPNQCAGIARGRRAPGRAVRITALPLGPPSRPISSDSRSTVSDAALAADSMPASVHGGTSVPGPAFQPKPRICRGREGAKLAKTARKADCAARSGRRGSTSSMATRRGTCGGLYPRPTCRSSPGPP